LIVDIRTCCDQNRGDIKVTASCLDEWCKPVLISVLNICSRFD
jgi:hypothetical protein